MNDGRSDLKKICGLLLIATAIALVVHLLSLDFFNKRENQVCGNDESKAVYLDMDARKDRTSTWIKRDFSINGESVNITGATFDGELHNTSSDTIKNWSLRINIQGDCFINQAWNGEVEIHQNAGTSEEAVQRLDLQDYSIGDVKLKHFYDGDLLIPLKAGDYVLYYPSESFKEVPVSGNDSVRMGVIFYYVDAIDLSDYELVFRYHRAFTQGPTFLVLAFLAILCFIFSIVYIASDVTYRRAQNDMELRKSGISWLSELYEAIYLIDLVSGVMTPIARSDKKEREHPWGAGARAFFADVVEDADDAYKDVVLDFIDFATLEERMSKRNGVVCEYVSVTSGWSCMRFIAIERLEDKSPEKVIFTIQDINEEKGELDRIEERIVRVESESRAKYAFMADISQEIRAPIREILGLGSRIIEESDDELARKHAKELCASGGDLLMFVEEILDYSKLQAGSIRLSPVVYTLSNLMCETMECALNLLQRRQVSFGLDVSPELPNLLRGDASRLKQIMCEIVVHASEIVGTGNVTLSVFGSVIEEKVHLLVSVRAIATSDHDNAGKLGNRRERDIIDEGASARIGLVSGLLELMGSEIKEVPSVDEWHEWYFEIDQEVIGAAPVGQLAICGSGHEGKGAVKKMDDAAGEDNQC